MFHRVAWPAKDKMLGLFGDRGPSSSSGSAIHGGKGNTDTGGKDGGGSQDGANGKGKGKKGRGGKKVDPDVPPSEEAVKRGKAMVASLHKYVMEISELRNKLQGIKLVGALAGTLCHSVWFPCPHQSQWTAITYA